MVKVSKLLSDKSRGISVRNRRDYINLSRKGLSYRQLIEILEYTNISMKQISKMIALSDRQLARYDDDKILKTDSSAHLIQILELYQFGYYVFEDREKFQSWMNSEIRGLGYLKPIDLLDTPFGIQDVTNELGRLEYGVYS